MFKEYKFDSYNVYEVGMIYNGNTKRVEFGVVFHLSDCQITNKAYLKGILTDKFYYGVFDYDMNQMEKHDEFENSMCAEFEVFEDSILQSLKERIENKHFNMPASIQKEILKMIKQQGAI